MRAVVLAAFLCGAIGAAAVTPALAIDKPDRPTPARPTKMLPSNLSESECTQLGGKVYSTVALGLCNSTKACQTTDENGKVHSVCINSK